MSRNLPLPELQKAFDEELQREGFTRHLVAKNAYISLRNSQTSFLPKIVVVTAHATINRLSVVGVTVNGSMHYGPRLGEFSETWRGLVNISLLWDDILDWKNHDKARLRPERRT